MASAFEKWVTGDDTDIHTWDSDADNFSKVAMTFTIGSVGDNLTFNLTSVDVKLFKTGAIQDVDISITEVLPDGSPDLNNVLSTGTILAASIPTVTGAWLNATMTTAGLKASTQYALVVSGQVTSASTIKLSWKADVGGGYAGGNLWTLAGAATVWVDQAPIDCLFQINGGDYAGTLCTLADARNKAGANVNTAAANESLMSDYVRQAEGLINANTRFNWVDAYSTLTDDVKFILNEVASNLAAISAITYDMSGFTDRVEAETMINVYRDAVLRGLSILRNQEVKSFMVGDA